LKTLKVDYAPEEAELEEDSDSETDSSGRNCELDNEKFFAGLANGIGG
jgi:hypothetical protein